MHADVDGRVKAGHDGKGEAAAIGRNKPGHDEGEEWQEWEISREVEAKWPDKIKALHKAWWDKRVERQKEIDKSIAAKAEYEYLYDKPYVDA